MGMLLQWLVVIRGGVVLNALGVLSGRVLGSSSGSELDRAGNICVSEFSKLRALVDVEEAAIACIFV